MVWMKKYEDLIRCAIITAIVYLGFRYLLPLFLPFLIAYLIAWILKKPVGFLYRRLKVKPALSGGLLMVALCGILGYGIVWLVRLLLEQFAALAGNYTFYMDKWIGYMQGICNSCDNFFHLNRGRTFHFLNNSLDGILLFFREELIPFLTKNSVKAAVSMTELVAAVIVVFVSVLLILGEIEEKEKREGAKRGFLHQEWLEIRKEISGAGIAYIKTQIILIALVSLTCSAGFFLLGNPYALLFGVAVGLFDAFPILGSVMILIPWSVISFAQGKMIAGAVLLTMYGICQFFREYLEPKLLGDKIGLKSICSLMAIYIGYELFGIAGVFLGPIGFVLIKSIYRVSKQR